MLIFVSFLLGAVTIIMAVHGGILAAAEKRNKRWFWFYGIVSVVLLVVQAIYLHRDETANHSEIGELKGSITNLRDQLSTLSNALKLQVSIDDIHHLEQVIREGFSSIEDLCKNPSKSSSPIPPTSPILPPAVVEHVRIIQRRAASENPKAHTDYRSYSNLMSRFSRLPSRWSAIMRFPMARL